jgi:putative membrane protein
MASTSPGAATHRGSLFFRPCGILRRMRIIIKWLLSAVALLAVAYLYSGVQVNSFGSALIAAAVIGLLNMIVRPVLVVLTLPVTIVTLGLFLFVINALLFWAASGLLGGFHVNGFVAALIGSLLYSLLGLVIESAVGGLLSKR